MIDIFFYYKFEIISKENKVAEMEDDLVSWLMLWLNCRKYYSFTAAIDVSFKPSLIGLKL
jgi:hypothetical protein